MHYVLSSGLRDVEPRTVLLCRAEVPYRLTCRKVCVRVVEFR